MALPAPRPHPGGGFHATVALPKLAWAVQLAKKTISTTSRRSLKILGYARLRTPSAGTLEFCATDYETWTTVRIPAAIDAPIPNDGALLIPIRALDVFLARSKTAAGEVTLAAPEPRTLSVHAVGYTELAGLDAADFPRAPDVPREGAAAEYFGESAPTWLQRLDPLLAVTSDDPSRLVLAGVRLAPTDEGRAYVLVATDGHRLVHIEVPAPDGHRPARAVVLPGDGLRVVQLLARTVAAHGKTVGRVQPPQLVAHVLPKPVDRVDAVFSAAGPLGDATIALRAFEHEFPDYAQVITSAGSPPLGFTVKRKPLVAALDRLKPILERSGDKVGLTATLEIDDRLRLEVTNATTGNKGRETLAVTTAEGTEARTRAVAFGVNMHYLRDAARAGTGPTMTLRFQVQPAKTTAEGEELPTPDEHGREVVDPLVITDPHDPGTLVLVMPMRL